VKGEGAYDARVSRSAPYPLRGEPLPQGGHDARQHVVPVTALCLREELNGQASGHDILQGVWNTSAVTRSLSIADYPV
jgi:hypothetical protein